MILSCPECATRYLVDPAVLGHSGRRVRCAKCNHVWLQAPPEDMPKDVPLPPPPPSVDSRRGPRGGANLPAAPRRRHRRLAGTIAWATLAASILLVVGGALGLRATVIRTWPAAEPFYQAIGLPGRELGAGLALRNVTSRESEQDGVRVLLVEGEVVNLSKSVRDVPRFRGALFDASDNELQRWRFSAPESRLLPGEAATFNTELRDPAKGAVRLTIVFDAEG